MQSVKQRSLLLCSGSMLFMLILWLHQLDHARDFDDHILYFPCAVCCVCPAGQLGCFGKPLWQFFVIILQLYLTRTHARRIQQGNETALLSHTLLGLSVASGAVALETDQLYCMLYCCRVLLVMGVIMQRCRTRVIHQCTSNRVVMHVLPIVSTCHEPVPLMVIGMLRASILLHCMPSSAFM